MQPRLAALLCALAPAAAAALRSRGLGPSPPGLRPEGDARDLLAAASEASASADSAARAAQRALAVAEGHGDNASQAGRKAAAGLPRAFDLHVAEGNPEDRHPFEGVGALSAGASSRLLKDYPQEQRSEILDLLFKPNYAASLQVLKVEIGGDTQSTDGSEPSHMRTRDERPNCTRGYETWLMQEAKRRNPKIRTYGLAWGVPGWVGNGSFFSQDNVRYHVAWLRCVRDTYGYEVDYLGIWNEMPWGEVWYVSDLAQAIAKEGLSTRLVLLDAVHGVDPGFVKLFEGNETFRKLVDAVGLHYPCERYEPLARAMAGHRATRFWASEELSTVADWGGAGCWGRMINQNFVRMNATSSIAWSLIWSAYPNLECFGNGLLYAFEPWSGHYEVTPPVWTTAHTTQFTEAGWQYLPVGEGAGTLPGGGTFVAAASPDLEDFSMVFETLWGQCFYHYGCHHFREAGATQLLRLHLGANLTAAARRKGGRLEVWATNETHWFTRQPDARVEADGTVEVALQPDAVVTLTTLRRASRRGDRGEEASGPRGTQLLSLPEPPPSSAFPLPYHESFDSQGEEREARFFSDQGGAFEVVAAVAAGAPGAQAAKGELPGQAPLRSFRTNHVLEQQVLVQPIAWNGYSPDPFTLVGGSNWTDMAAEVAARAEPPAEEAGAAAAAADPTLLAAWGPVQDANATSATDLANATGNATAAIRAAPRHTGLCVRISRYQFFGGGAPEGYCLDILDGPEPNWVLSGAGQTIEEGPVKPAAPNSRGWRRLRLEARGAVLHAFLDGEQVAKVIDTTFPIGQVALRCGYHRCQFDDLEMTALPPLPAPAPGTRRTLLRSTNILSFDYRSRSCDPAPRLARRRRDFTGFAGFAFVPKKRLTVLALGRLTVAGGHPWARVHNVSLFTEVPVGVTPSAARPLELASVALPTGAANQVGVEQTEDGWVYTQLRDPVTLEPGREYVLVSSELVNGDAFFDRAVRADPDDAVVVRGPAYLDMSGWHLSPKASFVYGPLNALLAPAQAPSGAKARTG